MGFFKNIGNAVKKGLKQVSLKNVVKLGTPLLGSIPIVGGAVHQVVSNASEAHELKKQADKLAKDGKIAEAQAMQQQAEYLATQTGALVGQQVGGQLNAFAKGAVNEAKAQVSQTAKETAGNVGAEIVDLTIKQWFEKHWLKVVLGVGALGGIFLYFRNQKSSKRITLKRR